MHGKPIVLHNPDEARVVGRETAHQDLALAPHLEVATNVFLGREASDVGNCVTRLSLPAGGGAQLAMFAHAAAWGGKNLTGITQARRIESILDPAHRGQIGRD